MILTRHTKERNAGRERKGQMSVENSHSKILEETHHLMTQAQIQSLVLMENHLLLWVIILRNLHHQGDLISRVDLSKTIIHQ